MFRSIFSKLIVITFVATIVINAFLYFGMRRFGPPPEGRKVIEKNIALYLAELAKNLGENPTEARLDEVAKATGLSILYEKNGKKILTEDGLDEIDIEERPKPARRSFGMRGRPYHAITVGNADFIFFAPQTTRIENSLEGILRILAFVTAIILVMFLVVRRMLRPIKELTEGIQSLAEGDLKHRVAVVNNDEIGNLAQAFNKMSGRIQEMIEGKERLLIDISHEFQSPLARMKLGTEMLKDEKRRQGFERDIGDMEKMVCEILETARLTSSPGALHFCRTEVVQLIKQTLSAYADQNPGVVFTPSQEEIFVDVDSNRIVTVLRNLVDNAIKYSDERGLPVEVSLADLSESIQIQVRDHGLGISNLELKNIFEPFFRTDKSRSKKTGGYGLGLSLCQKIIHAHNGKIKIESGTPIKGTLVTVVIPKARN